jgi:NADPH-dependent glutamate synthase beta subunit-like oxidoreductase
MHLVRATLVRNLGRLTYGGSQDPRARVSKRVCIIGAGATGLATLKVLSENHQGQSGRWSLVAFEERDKVGGIWYCPQNSLFLHLAFFSDFLN